MLHKIRYYISPKKLRTARGNRWSLASNTQAGRLPDMGKIRAVKT